MSSSSSSCFFLLSAACIFSLLLLDHGKAFRINSSAGRDHLLFGQRLINRGDQQQEGTINEDADGIHSPLTFVLMKRRLPWKQQFKKKDAQLPSFNLDTLAGIGLGKRSSIIEHSAPPPLWRIEEGNFENDRNW